MGESKWGQFDRLAAMLGDRGRVNTEAGRWCRLTKFQIEVIAAALLYVALCGLFVAVRVVVVASHWIGGWW